MVQINNEKQQITITMPGQAEKLEALQKSIIYLMQRYDEKFGQDAETFYNLLELLAALIPDSDQQKRGLVSEADYLELPEALTPKQRQSLKDAIFEIKHEGTKIRNTPNPVALALTSISI